MNGTIVIDCNNQADRHLGTKGEVNINDKD